MNEYALFASPSDSACMLIFEPTATSTPTYTNIPTTPRVRCLKLQILLLRLEASTSLSDTFGFSNFNLFTVPVSINTININMDSGSSNCATLGISPPNTTNATKSGAIVVPMEFSEPAMFILVTELVPGTSNTAINGFITVCNIASDEPNINEPSRNIKNACGISEPPISTFPSVLDVYADNTSTPKPKANTISPLTKVPLYPIVSAHFDAVVPKAG